MQSGPIARRTAANEREVVGDVKADLELDALEALPAIAFHFLDDVIVRIAGGEPVGARRVGLDVGAQGPAHEPVNRRAEMLALDIPERDVDAAQRGDGEAFLALVAEFFVQQLPQAFARQRVLTDEIGAIGAHDGGVERRRAETFAPAFDAAVGDDLDDAARCGGSPN